jgi:arabinoxylan arabinofuranohydrolase
MENLMIALKYYVNQNNVEEEGIMKYQAVNPYLPSYEYIPDGEPHIFDDRVYVYGSHDKFNGINFCLNDYVCWSSPVDDLSDWRYEGVIFKRTQDPDGTASTILRGMAAPDVCRGVDGKYYLYYFIGGTGMISVAACDTPAGKYEYLGHIRYEDGIPVGKKREPLQFDPGIFIDDDGRIYLYSGFGLYSNPFLLWGHKPSDHGAMCFELEKDMLTVKSGPVYIGIKGKKESAGTAYDGHEFLEASSMRKFNGTYYFIYSSYLSHELCYATSNSPTGEFKYGGTLISNGDIGLNGRKKKDAVNYTGNTHGSLIEIGGKYYVFYHRQTNRKQFSRQACAEEIKFVDGKFLQAELTSCGLNGKPLEGKGVYEARIACNLTSRNGARWYWALKGPRGIHPYFTQTGKDREDSPDQYIANFTNGATAGFKYFEFHETHIISVTVRGKARGKMIVSNEKGSLPVGEIEIFPCKKDTVFSAPMGAVKGKQALYFTFLGKGKLDFVSFKLGL